MHTVITFLRHQLSVIRMAWSCLALQLSSYQELKMQLDYAEPVQFVPTVIYLTDDATPDELIGMAAEQRTLNQH